MEEVSSPGDTRRPRQLRLQASALSGSLQRRRGAAQLLEKGGFAGSGGLCLCIAGQIVPRKKGAALKKKKDKARRKPLPGLWAGATAHFGGAGEGSPFSRSEPPQRRQQPDLGPRLPAAAPGTSSPEPRQRDPTLQKTLKSVKTASGR